jgi:transcriptional regulator with XRE-family HTH domain
MPVDHSPITSTHDADRDAFYAELGDKIRRARKSSGLTQQALASLISLTRVSVTNIEMGRQKLMLHTLFDIAGALKVEPCDLLPVKPVITREDWDELLKGRPHDEQRWIRSAVSSRTLSRKLKTKGTRK